jgi:hypothetical protein
VSSEVALTRTADRSADDGPRTGQSDAHYWHAGQTQIELNTGADEERTCQELAKLSIQDSEVERRTPDDDDCRDHNRESHDDTSAWPRSSTRGRRQLARSEIGADRIGTALGVRKGDVAVGPHEIDGIALQTSTGKLRMPREDVQR